MGNCESTPLRVQELDQVGLVGGKPLPGRLELPHAVPAIDAFPLRLVVARRDDGIDSLSPCGPVLDADRPDLDLVALTLEDDVIVVVVSLGMDDPSQIQVHPA